MMHDEMDMKNLLVCHTLYTPQRRKESLILGNSLIQNAHKMAGPALEGWSDERLGEQIMHPTCSSDLRL